MGDTVQHPKRRVRPLPQFPSTAHSLKNPHTQNNGGTIISNAGKVINDRRTMECNQDRDARWARAREFLRALVVVNATRTGRVRAEPLRCDPKTRQAIILDVVAWILNHHREKNILWLTGPAGIGKSAIAMRTAENLDQPGSGAKVVGSFLFFGGDPQRNNTNRLIPTLAYQIAVSLEDVGREIDKVITTDPKVLQMTLEIQWEELIVKPVKAVPNIPPAVIILDGLDECGGSKDQKKVLNLIASCGPKFPIAFLIASRPDPPITTTFESQPLASLCRPKIDLAQCKDHREMEIFVRSNFSRIYAKYYDILRCYALHGVWPSDKIVKLIVLRADGQFIYPVTLFDHIEVDDANPQERLNMCLQRVPEALSPLDTLYMNILRSTYKPEDDQMQDLIFFIINGYLSERVGMFYSTINIDSLMHLLRIYEGQGPVGLRKLHSVLAIPPELKGNKVTVHHKSFTDFILNPQRSGPYYINQERCATRIILRCLDRLIFRIGSHEQTASRHQIDFLLCWWRCCYWYFSDRSISENLAARMMGVEFIPSLMFLAASDTFSNINKMDGDYKDFSTTCKLWKFPGLTAKFEPGAFRYGIQAATLQSIWMRILQYESLSSHKMGYHAFQQCPMTWDGTISLAKAFLKDSPIIKPDRTLANQVVLISVSAFADSKILRTLTQDEIQFLRTWSLAWKPSFNSAIAISEEEPVGVAEFREVVHRVLSLLEQLPKRYHYHELNGLQVIRWLERNMIYLPPTASNVLGRWRGGESPRASRWRVLLGPWKWFHSF